MNILVFNCGSSSLNCKVFHALPSGELAPIVQAKAHHVGVQSQEAPYIDFHYDGNTTRLDAPLPDHAAAAGAILDWLDSSRVRVDASGHRFVHGGTSLHETTRITSDNLPLLEACAPLAPLHNPAALAVIHICRQRLGEIPLFAAFDTAFHARMPGFASRYALPGELRELPEMRKYGFHGLSYQYVTAETARYLDIPVEKLRLIACHLGTGGSSAAAINGGHSVDNSMGSSPLAGLIMSTRCGDLDPTIPLTLVDKFGYTPQEVGRLLNKESGLVGISGFSSDLFEIVDRAEAGSQPARLAVDMYVHRLKRYIGAFLAVLGGCDALVFTDDIGQRCWQIREAACRGLEPLGIVLDEDANRSASGGETEAINKPESPIHVLVVPTDEELVIARDCLRLLHSE